MRALPVFLLLPLLAACAPFPALETMQADAGPMAPFPALVPLDPVLAQADALGPGQDPAAALQGRAAALEARADALRGPVVDAETRARMQQAAAGGALQ